MVKKEITRLTSHEWKKNNKTATTAHFHFINICLLILFSSENDNYPLVIRTPPNPFRRILMNYVAKFSKYIYIYNFSFKLKTLSIILAIKKEVTF